MDLTLLKEERMRRGITQEKLAKSLGFKDKSSYCLIENGKTSITVDIANKIIINLDLPKDVAYKIFFASEVQESSTNNIIAHGGDKENAKYNSKNQLQHIL